MDLRLAQLVSPALPVGAFAYSRGLEKAVELGWVPDAAGAERWIGGLLEASAGKLDAPLVLRVHRAGRAGDEAALRRWALFADATRETAELQAESRQLGRSLARLLVDLGVLGSPPPPEVSRSHLACFALACARWQIGETDSLEAYLWSWLEGQVSAATKLVPLGQTDAQRILARLAGRVPALAREASAIEDDDVGALAPGLAIASALHEAQHTRLFRS